MARAKAAKSTGGPGLREGGWTTAQRRKLSAIRAPHKSDPKDFYYGASSAEVALAKSGSFPSTLTHETETARAVWLAQYVGVSWRETAGRSFTDEYWNPLIGLWVERCGWEFVFDLLIPNRDEPHKNNLWSVDASAQWAGVRRYLHRASPDEAALAKNCIEPLFQRLLKTESWDERRIRDLIAFAFDRDTDWPRQILDGYLNDGIVPFLFDPLVAVNPDANLSLKAVTRRGSLREVYWVFDTVETLGHAAAPLLKLCRPHGAPDKKRVAQAIALAEKLVGIE